MYLGSFPIDSTFMYLGFWIFSETLKLMKPWYPVIVIAVLFYLVWHTLKTGDWLHTVGGYLFYVLLLLVLLSHTTVISLANIKPYSASVRQDKSQSVSEAEALKEIAVGISSVRVPTVFLFSIKAMDYFSNKLADIISNGKYLAGSFEFIHAQAAIANAGITGEVKEDYIHFCVECFNKVRVELDNAKRERVGTPTTGYHYKTDPDWVDPSNRWYIGCGPYVKKYKNYKIIWKGNEIWCNEAYEQLSEDLIGNLQEKFIKQEEAKNWLTKTWGVKKFTKWITQTDDAGITRKTGTANAMLYRILYDMHKKLMKDPKVINKMHREILPSSQLSKDRFWGLLGGAIPASALLAKVSLFIKIAFFVRGACLCLCIGAFPILIFLSLFPRSVRVFKTAFLFILTVEFWSVSWAIVDLLSQSLAKFLPGGFYVERIDIPMFTLLMVVVAPIISSVFVSGRISALSGMLAVPAGSPASAASTAKVVAR